MKYSFFIIFILLFTASCSKETKTTYRIVGKDGRVMYIDTRDPDSIDKTRKSLKNQTKDLNDKQLSLVNNYDTTKQTKDTKSPLISNAYTLNSVMDKNVKYDVGTNSSFKDIGSEKKQKTIKDFDGIDLPYFNEVDYNINIAKKPISNGTNTNKAAVNARVTAVQGIKASVLSDGLKDSGYYLQIGMFSDKNKALALKNKFSKIYNFDIIEVKNKDNKPLYKVVTKALSSESDVDKVSEKVKKVGHNDIFIFKK